MTHSRTLISTITQKASDSYTGDKADLTDFDHNGIAQAGFLRWQDHWLDTARKWKDELANEGLLDTAQAIDKVIGFFSRSS